MAELTPCLSSFDLGLQLSASADEEYGAAGGHGGVDGGGGGGSGAAADNEGAPFGYDVLVRHPTVPHVKH